MRRSLREQMREPCDVGVEAIEMRLAEAEARAWRSLAGYKFWMFGYHAAQWVMLNRLAGGQRPNPFRPLVELARASLPDTPQLRDDQ